MKTKMTIDSTELLLNSKGKLNKSMDDVRRGTGVWKEKKKYDRNREKEKLHLIKKGYEYEDFDDE